MSVAGGFGISAQVQQILAYWRTRIEAIRSQWLGKLGGGLIPKTSAMTGFRRQTITRQPTVRRAPTQTVQQAPITIAPSVAQKIQVPGEKYDFSYKSRKVGAVGERYDFTY